MSNHDEQASSDRTAPAPPAISQSAPLGERMVAAGIVSKEDLARALEYQQKQGGLLGHAFVALDILSEEGLQAFFSHEGLARAGERMVSTGLITGQQLVSALDYQTREGGRLGNAIVALGYAKQPAVDAFYRQEPAKTDTRIGNALLDAGLITPEKLEHALTFQRSSGGRLGEILLLLGYVDEKSFYKVLATQLQMGRRGDDLDFAGARKLPFDVALRYNAVVINTRTSDDLLAVSAPLPPEAEAEIVSYLGRPVQQVLASTGELESYFEMVYSTDESEDSLYKLLEEQPENSAIVTFSRMQRIIGAALLISLLILIVLDYVVALFLLNLILQLLYGIFTVLKGVILTKGIVSRRPLRFTPEQIAAIDERDLPVYTVLLPTYREPEVIKRLVRNMENLDYPQQKLDVRLLLEADDTETIGVLESMKLPTFITQIIVPPTKPQTKPKACNYGLIHARGEFVVIYDAEDMPEPDQLKKAYLAFKQLPASYVCVQARLNYYNNSQNILTRWFTQEYSTWFDSLLVGIMEMDLPIPLGGTSNHFKTAQLRELGAWDPFNVTEDCDLGVRLSKMNYDTAIIDSRTWEEANSRLSSWIRQRSHWIKGYMQTWLVHMRHPMQMLRTLGLKRFIGYQTVVMGTWITPILNPFFWLMLILWFTLEPAILQRIFPGFLYFLAALLLVAGNFLFAYTNIVGTYMTVRENEMRGRMDIPYSILFVSLLLPVYWVFMSIAGYRALFQLLYKPFHWDKTTHGFAQQPLPDDPPIKERMHEI